jgi:hypothetical protein
LLPDHKPCFDEISTKNQKSLENWIVPSQGLEYIDTSQNIRTTFLGPYRSVRQRIDVSLPQVTLVKVIYV